MGVATRGKATGKLQVISHNCSLPSPFVTVIQCKPNTFGGYDASKTQYNSGTLRACIMMVETSNQKTPSRISLGSPRDILNTNGAGSGHITRNLRVALLALDLVEPYLTMESVNDVALTTDLVPLQSRDG